MNKKIVLLGVFLLVLSVFTLSITLFNKDENHLTKEDEKILREYGYEAEEVISVVDKTLPDFNNISSNDLEGLYFLYNNELSKDTGFDISKLANNQNIKMYIIRLKENISAFYPYEETNAVLLKLDNKIVGAYLSSESYSFLDALSFKQNDFDSIIKAEKYKDFYDWYDRKVSITKKEKQLYKLSKTDIIKKYYEAENKGDIDTLISIMDKKSLFKNISLEKNGTLTNLQEEGWKNIKSVKLLNLKENKWQEENKSYPKKSVYTIDYDVKYKTIMSEDNGKSSIDCYMIKPNKDSRWMIQEFGRG